jgi:hypothetical protein
MSRPSLSRFLAALFVAAFALNWLWEMLQMPAYVELAGRPWGETALVCTLATLGDVAITLFIYAAGALITRRPRWAVEGGWKVYLFAGFTGALFAILIEWAALSTARWSYTDRMPEALGAGLLPLLQLTLLVPAAFCVAAWWHRRGAHASAARDWDQGHGKAL